MLPNVEVQVISRVFPSTAGLHINYVIARCCWVVMMIAEDPLELVGMFSELTDTLTVRFY